MADGGVPVEIAYQGLAGAYSEAAAAALFPRDEPRPRRTFAEVFESLGPGGAGAAVVPVENTHAGAVADVYDLLRQHAGVRIVAEAVIRVRHCLLALPGTERERIARARSHPQALAQVEDYLRRHAIEPVVAYDTAGAAAEV
ncbi:MAG: prephenate dehydratase domain-containing protein, partial [Candidatus Limnocylindria bacterium]